MFKKNFAGKIIAWYRQHQRVLPWRETKDPYKIWLSEIILQQTRVAQGIPYYLKFVERFPDVETLARASEQEVLRLWQGLGYYSRARNLHRCAGLVAQMDYAKFPDNFIDLQKLPGIGSYTAAAIASIAFREPVAVVDGNVYRVLARIFGIEKDIAAADSKDYFFKRANELISPEHPDEFNQAMMEFGAIHCLPRNPRCGECIFKRSCVAFANQSQTLLPVKSKKSKPRRRYLYYFVLQQGEKIAMRKRSGKDIWLGLFDFHGHEKMNSQKPEKIVDQYKALDKLNGRIEVGEPSNLYKHILTHQTLLVTFIPIKIKSGKPLDLEFDGQPLKFYSRKQINEFPKPALVSRYLADSGFL